MALKACPLIIVVEDDLDIRATLHEFLSLEGYRVESFPNGKEALARLHIAPEPCLILLDLMMPVMDGAEFMVEFSKFPAAIVPIPVFLVSGTASAEESERMGCYGFMKKPVDLEVLLVVVQKFCRTHAEIASDLVAGKREASQKKRA
jgi:CheY-like chemotaxis protein